MLLLIDAGNTRIKWALAELQGGLQRPQHQPWIEQGAVATAEVGTLALAWRGYAITRVMISNVAGSVVAAGLAQQLQQLAQSLHPQQAQPQQQWFAATRACAGLQNGYREPSSLGVDRFAAAIGARALYGKGALLVVTCGTATTIDAVSAQGVFEGGLILPGLDMMAAALARNTAQLPQLEAEHAARFAAPLASPFADHTSAAIASGCLAAQCGAIERAFHQFSARQPGVAGPVSCILAGGAAASIAPHLTIPFQLAGNLVLAGLYHVAMERPTPC